MSNLVLLFAMVREVVSSGAFTIETRSPADRSPDGRDQERPTMLKTVIQADADVVRWAHPSALADSRLLRNHERAVRRRLKALRMLRRGINTAFARFGSALAGVGLAWWIAERYDGASALEGVAVGPILTLVGSGTVVAVVARWIALRLAVRIARRLRPSFGDITS